MPHEINDTPEFLNISGISNDQYLNITSLFRCMSNHFFCAETWIFTNSLVRSPQNGGNFLCCGINTYFVFEKQPCNPILNGCPKEGFNGLQLWIWLTQFTLRFYQPKVDHPVSNTRPVYVTKDCIYQQLFSIFS